MAKRISEGESSFELRHKNIGKLLLKYSLPSVVSMLIVSLYNIVDRIYIGHGLGVDAISGIALTLPISAVVTAVGTLIGVGASARISIVLGKNDVNWARNILCHFPILTILVSSVFSLFSFIYLDELLNLFGATENTFHHAKAYLLVLIPTSFLSNLCFGFSNILRASGFPRKSMYAILIGVILNMILDPIFLFWLKTGIEGVAIATAISMAVGAIYSTLHFLNKSNTISFHWNKYKFNPHIVRNIVSIGFSPFIMNFISGGIVMFINSQLAKHGGDNAIGAFGIIYSYQLFLTLLIFGISQGMQPILGFNYGANNLKRVKDTLFLTLKISTLCTIPFFVLAEFFPELLARAFTSDPELIKLCIEGFRYCFMGSLFIGFPIVISVFFLSIGKAGKSMIMSLLRQVIILLPLLYILPTFLNLKGAWIAISISDFLTFVISLIFIIYELNHLYNTHILKIPKKKHLKS